MKCTFCGSIYSLTKDHIHPKSRGGTNKPHNIQLLCHFCNSQKGNHTDFELGVIFSDIKKNGVWYSWEEKYKNWLQWLETKCEERNHKCPLL